MIGFNNPYETGKEFFYLRRAYENKQLAGDGELTRECEKILQNISQSQKCLLTHSCTGALEMAALLCGITNGDEIIMPSFTFVSTANAFVLRGATPKFVDIRPDTLNIDENKIEAAITPKTKAIVVVHYAGVSAEMKSIKEIAKKHNLFVIEDAAQALMSSYMGKPLGSIGDLGTYSFHETKNIISGEGGSLVVNNIKLLERAEIIREKGTNRTRFFRGEIDKYTWCDLGSSYLPGELIAAFLLAQLKEAEDITKKRLKIWQTYYKAFEDVEKLGIIKRPVVPSGCSHNGHIFYLILNNESNRNLFIQKMKESGIHCVFHYLPLHNSSFAQYNLNVIQELKITELRASQIVRLPLWIGIEKYQDFIISTATNLLHSLSL